MVTVVSGLPRSGTSFVMQALKAHGMPILADSDHKADSFNPKGYLEWEAIKQLPHNPELIRWAEGKAVKVFSPWLRFLPAGHEYELIFTERPLREVLESQGRMLGALSQERFGQLQDRQVGFELFDARRAQLLPKKTYVAIHGRYVLLGFSEKAQAEEFFAAAMKATL